MEKMNVIKHAYEASAYGKREKSFLKNPSQMNAERLASSAMVKAHGWFSRKKDPVPLLLQTSFLLANNKAGKDAIKLAEIALDAEAGKKDACWLFELTNLIGLAKAMEPSKAREFFAKAFEILRQNKDLSACIVLQIAVVHSDILMSGSEKWKKEQVGLIIGDLLNRTDLYESNGELLDFAKILAENGFGKNAVTLIRQAIFYAESSKYGSSRGSDDWEEYVADLAEGVRIAGLGMDTDDWKVNCQPRPKQRSI